MLSAGGFPTTGSGLFRLFKQPLRLPPSAELRAQAAVAVDRIMGSYSTDVAGDWREVERLLQQAYRSVQQAAQPAGP